jgi:ribose/xylose/arabinose/galactoside ABC-type transport system permease subunit
MEKKSIKDSMQEKINFEIKALLRNLVIFIFLVVAASVLSKGVFLQSGNLVNIIKQNTLLIVVSLGQFLIILTGGIDLSVGSVLALASVNFVLFYDYGIIPALLIALFFSILVGLINGVLVTYVRLPSFVVTLGSSLVALSVAMVISKGGTIKHTLSGTQIPENISDFFNQSILGIPYPAIIILVALLFTGLFLRTSTGHFIYTIGGNEKAAVMSGIPVQKIKVLTYMIASLFAGIAGVLFVFRVGLGNPQTGISIPLDSIASVSIGGTSLSGGVGTVPGTLIGVFSLSALTNILNILNIPPTLQHTFKGIVILIAVYLNSFRKE